MSNDWCYDVETFPNVFTLDCEHVDSGMICAFEISPWRNDSREIVAFLYYLKESGARMVGFNNLGFDYPVLHTLIRMGTATVETLYAKAMAIINSQDDENRWAHMVYESDRLVPQIDLYKIHHFDNRARSTSLKMLEFNMRVDSVQDLPFPVGSVLTQEQLPILKRYNRHDVKQTKAFYLKSLDMIRFREELTKKYQRDFMNHNDTKIGKDFFVMKLEEAGVSCYDYSPDKGRTPRQTLRPRIALKDAILPWIEFEHPEFTRVLNWLKTQVITETKGVFDDVVATVNGFDFVFGLGGIHGSVESEVIQSDSDFVLVDLDVTSMYPSLAIANGFYPKHLGQQFCTIYKALFEQRKSYPKKSAESAMLKLALNGVYGDSNNKFSVFYDPLFTMSITLNGQLLLCKLAEMILTWTDAELIQVNTDGVTVKIKRSEVSELEKVRTHWQNMTKLNLEEAFYRRMFIRDVNNYLAEYEDGSVKRKGAYEYDQEWHQNHSALVIAKVTEKVLLHGAPIRETVEQWPDIMDFMLRTKVQRTGYLQWGEGQVQNLSRYYVAKGGKPLIKWLPPLAKNPTKWRPIGVESGWNVQVCNDIKDAVLPVDYSYYVMEIEKLTLGLS